MTSSLLKDLGPAALLLLQYAARKDVAPLHLLTLPPQDEDPMEALTSLQERGLVEEAEESPGHVQLSPMGLALRDALIGGWPAVHGALRERLLTHLRVEHDLDHTGRLYAALEGVDRSRFVAPEVAILADLDVPLPTPADDMSTSAPHALIAILATADPRPGDRVLVCGAKGGMTMALAAHMVGAEGSVVGVDWDPVTVAHVQGSLRSHPDLASRCRAVFRADVTEGLDAEAPWQVVVMNGSVPKIPRPIVEQLDPSGGRLLFFLQQPGEHGQSCYLYTRGGGAVRDAHLSRFVFTPLYGRWGWDRVSDLR